jgi:NADH dehydrogenase
MILVVGATGLLGSEICGALAARGKRVRALARATSDPAKTDRLRAFGAEIVPGDLRDADSLRAACQGVSAIITTASALPFAYQPGGNSPQITDRDGYLSLIATARDAGVQRFVYTSFPPMAIPFPLQDAKRAVEASLRSSGLTYTILQPTFFSEIWLSPPLGFDYPNRKATIYGEGKNPISWISYSDVARFAVAALSSPAALDATLELGGPEALSPFEVVGIFERIGGQPFEVAHVPIEALRCQLAAATDPMQQSFSGLMLGYADGKAIDMRETLKTLPVRLTSVEEYARQLERQHSAALFTTIREREVSL